MNLSVLLSPTSRLQTPNKVMWLLSKIFIGSVCSVLSNQQILYTKKPNISLLKQVKNFFLLNTNCMHVLIKINTYILDFVFVLEIWPEVCPY